MGSPGGQAATLRLLTKQRTMVRCVEGSHSDTQASRFAQGLLETHKLACAVGLPTDIYRSSNVQYVFHQKPQNTTKNCGAPSDQLKNSACKPFVVASQTLLVSSRKLTPSNLTWR
jgi:hypothetical protein